MSRSSFKCYPEDCLANNFVQRNSDIYSQRTCSSQDCYGSIRQALQLFCTKLPSVAWAYNGLEYLGISVSIIKVKLILLNPNTNEKIGTVLSVDQATRDCESILPIMEAIEQNPTVNLRLSIEVVGTLDKNSSFKQYFYQELSDLQDNQRIESDFLLWGFGPIRKNEMYWPYLCKVRTSASPVLSLGFVGLFNNVTAVVKNAKSRLISLTFDPIIIRNLANVLDEAKEQLPTDVLEQLIGPYLMKQEQLPPNQYQRKRQRDAEAEVARTLQELPFSRSPVRSPTRTGQRM